jgi:hypothetical protein
VALRQTQSGVDIPAADFTLPTKKMLNQAVSKP